MVFEFLINIASISGVGVRFSVNGLIMVMWVYVTWEMVWEMSANNGKKVKTSR